MERFNHLWTETAHTHIWKLTDLLTSLHDDGNSRDEICSLLSHFGWLVVESPQDGTTDLRQVGLHSFPKRVHHCAKPIQHHHILWIHTAWSYNLQHYTWFTLHQGKHDIKLWPSLEITIHFPQTLKSDRDSQPSGPLCGSIVYGTEKCRTLYFRSN